MATIGLDKLYYAPITAGTGGAETYGTPVQLAKAITAELSVELNEAILYADDGQAESVREFKSGTISLNVDDLPPAAAAALLGATVDENGVLISRGEDSPAFVAIGFRARKADGKYRYFWLYRVQFAVPGNSLQTKGDSITDQGRLQGLPPLEGGGHRVLHEHLGHQRLVHLGLRAHVP